MSADRLIYRCIAFLLCTVGLGALGYFLGGIWLMTVLGIIGAVLGIAFGKIIAVLILAAFLAAMVGGVIWVAVRLVL